jgi:hypothetical protein
MENMDLKNVMNNITCNIKKFRDQLEEESKTFDVRKFIEMVNSQANVNVDPTNLCNFMNNCSSANSSTHSRETNCPVTGPVTGPVNVPVNIFANGESQVSSQTDLESLMQQLLKNESEALIINRQIEKLSYKDRQRFWAKYHGVPLDETSIKLDTVISSLATLNSNIVNNFNYKEQLEDILDEIEILRKEMNSKPVVE